MTDKEFEYIVRYIDAKKENISKEADVNVEGMSTRVANGLNTLHKDGYELVQVVPINGGRYDRHIQNVEVPDRAPGKAYTAVGYAAGYSMTDGLLLIARRIKNAEN